MFEKAFLLAGVVTAIITSNSDIAFNESNLYGLQSQIPELVELVEIPENPDLRIRHEESDSFSITQSETDILLKEHWNSKLSPDLPHLLYAMVHQYWLNHGLFVIHSACVGNDQDGYVLLVGEAGCGKTSTALECARRYGLKIFSGDKTVVEVDEDANLWGIGGTKVLTSRAPEEGRWKEMVDKVVRTSSRYSFRLKDEHYANVKRVPIKAIVLLYLNEGRDSIEEFSKISAVHNLYPFFMDSQREDVLLNEGNSIYFGTVQPDVKQKNVVRLSQGIKKSRTFNVIGSMDYVTQQVIKVLKDPA